MDGQELDSIFKQIEESMNIKIEDLMQIANSVNESELYNNSEMIKDIIKQISMLVHIPVTKESEEQIIEAIVSQRFLIE